MFARSHEAIMQNRTGLVYDHRLSRHFHLWNDSFTEKPERTTVPYAVCQKYKLVERCRVMKCREATESEMLTMHSAELLDIIRETQHLPEDELRELSKQYDFIYFHPMVFESASLALGGTLDLVSAVLKDELQNGLAIIRPPGHHAMYNTFCGYCYMNNVATAARMAIDNFGLQRVLIVDWDVHHGQGTQYMFYDDPRVLYFSIHTYDYGREWPCLRESDYDYIGTGPGKGFNINIPLNENGCDNTDYMAIMQQVLLPVAYEFCPELVLVSAGYDSAIGCPEGQMAVTPAMYGHFVSLLSTLANGKICLIQEGGYCIESLAESIAMSLKTLLGDPCPPIDPLETPRQSVTESILNAIKVLRPYWKCLRYQDDLHDMNSEHFEGVMDLPPKPGVSFFSESNQQKHYDLFQDCFDPLYLNRRQELLAKIDLLIRNTKLTFAPNRLCIAYDERMLLHKNLSNGECEERAERVTECYDKLKEKGLLQRSFQIQGREAEDVELLLAHDLEFVDRIKKTSKMSERSLVKCQRTFTDIYLCKDSYQSASVAVGTLLNVVDTVMTDHCQAGVALVRPPGHHSEKSVAMGFCIFNNIGIATKYAQQTYNVERILIVDWDIHHGNSLQSLFYKDPSVLYISLHRSDDGSFYPCGEYGDLNHCGSDIGAGFNVNIPWNDGPKGDGDYIAAFQQIVMPIAYQFGPDLVFIAAGFDPGAGDLLGAYNVTPSGFAHMTQMLKGLANGKLIVTLEGGYGLETTSNSLCACVSVLLGDACPSLSSVIPSESALKDIKKILDVQKKHWSCLKFREKLPTEDQLRKVVSHVPDNPSHKSEEIESFKEKLEKAERHEQELEDANSENMAEMAEYIDNNEAREEEAD